MSERYQATAARNVRAAYTHFISSHSVRHRMNRVADLLDGLVRQLRPARRAIDWAVQHDIKVVNLSLGTSNQAHEPALRAVVYRALAQGVIIVAAGADSGTRWLPGSLPGCVQVGLDWECPREEYRVIPLSCGRMVFRASGYPRPIPGVDPSRNLKGISFAVANMTGFVARVLEEHPDLTLGQLVATLNRMG